MTNAGTVTTAVEQAFLHNARDGTTSVVASSLDGEDAELSWLGLLVPDLAGNAIPGKPQPAYALSYLTYPGGFAAVLRRSWDAGRPGTVDTHALLGVAALLTPETALAAQDWPGWLAEPPVDRRMSRLRLEQLPGPDTEARARALAQADLLARSLAWLLQSPAAPLGLLGCPEVDRTALVWALREIAAPLLGQREWTFCTHGDADHGGPPTAITFFDARPASPTGTDRIVVDLGRDQGASPHNEYRANALVYRFEYGVDPPNVEAAPDPTAPDSATQDVLAWDPAAGYPEAAFGPVGRYFWSRGWAMTPVRERRLVTALRLLALLLSCLLGLVIGGVLW